MASPVAHSLAAIALGPVTAPERPIAWRWYAAAVVAANAPDLDFIPGLLIGDINRFHQSFSHSLFAAGVFGFIAALVMARDRLQRLAVGMGMAALYASHMLLDFFTNDVKPPIGQPLLWPLSSARFNSPWTPLGGLRHGNPGEPLSVFLSQVFSWHNVVVIGREAVLLAPFFIVAWYFLRQKPRTDNALNTGS